MNGWNIYYIIPLASVASLSLPFLLRLFGRGRKPAPALVPEAGEISPERRLNSRFLLALNAGTALLLQGIVLIPCMAIFNSILSSGERVEIWHLLVVFLLLCVVLLGGLFYALRKGDLDWLE